MLSIAAAAAALGTSLRLDITITPGWTEQEQHAVTTQSPCASSTGVVKSKLVLKKQCKTSAVFLTDCEDHATPIQDRIKKRMDRVASEPTHPGRKLFYPLPSCRRYRALHTKTSLRKSSFLGRCSNSCKLHTHEYCLLETHSATSVTQILLLRCNYIFPLSYLCQYNPEGCQQQDPFMLYLYPNPPVY